jgi:hypothetical protein
VGFASTTCDWERQRWEKGWRVVRRETTGLGRESPCGAVFHVRHAKSGRDLCVHAGRVRPNNDAEWPPHADYWKQHSASWNIGNLVARRTHRNGDDEFLVEWEGWDAAYNSWEPESNICMSTGGNLKLTEFREREKQSTATADYGRVLDTGSPTGSHAAPLRTTPNPQPDM